MQGGRAQGKKIVGIENYHRLLKRQIKKFLGGNIDSLPPDFIAFIEDINDTYINSDKERTLLERIQENNALEMSSYSEREKELALLQSKVQMLDSFARFVPKEFLKFLNKGNITDVRLGDQVQKEMTVLFSDIRDFTTLSEKLSPQENFNFINSYLSRMGPHVRKHNGFIDKYIGDAIMALFSNLADDALYSAIDMQKEVRLYNIHRENSGYEPVRIGIGIHTGNLMLGIIGEHERMEGTVISDAVNIASRLENLTKVYGASLIISEESLTKLENPGKYKYRKLDIVKMKGKTKDVTVYQVMEGFPENMIDLLMETKFTFETGLDCYNTGEFYEGLDLFLRVMEKNPNDKATILYIKRCKQAILQGTRDDWEKKF